MDDNQDSSAPEGTATGEPVTSDAGSTPSGYVTPDQLADFGKDLMGNFRKTMAGMLKTQTSSEPAMAPTATPAPTPAPVDVKAIVRHERVTTDAIARSGLSQEQGEMARQLMEAQNPEDPAAFISNFAKTIGASAPGTSAPPTPKATPNPNPASDGGTPGMTPTLESDDVPIWKWSQEKIDKYVREKGYREFANMSKQRLSKDLQGVRFSLPKG